MDYTTDEDGSTFTETVVGRRKGKYSNLWDIRLLSNKRGFFFSKESSGWWDLPQNEAQWADILIHDYPTVKVLRRISEHAPPASPSEMRC